MPVSGSDSVGKARQCVVVLKAIGAPVNRWCQTHAPSVGPLRQALFVDKPDSPVSREPQPAIGIVEYRKDLIGWQPLLRAYREQLPIFEPAQSVRGADPQIAVAVYEERVYVR